ncbi:hypothetical protein FOA52_001840 [Chlamydomonas sp. UWO 241]|nr:hypothetical protein FOA52_001840 [Chlamydomonas sp. UWO 241]
MALMAFAGRALMVAIFIGSAVTQLYSWDAVTGGPTAAYMGPKLDSFFDKVSELTKMELTSEVQPHYPHIVLAAALLQLLGGALVLAGARFGSVVLLAFMMPTTFIVHAFWFEADPEIAHIELVNFMKNLSIIGGLMMFLAGSSPPRSKSKYD